MSKTGKVEYGLVLGNRGCCVSSPQEELYYTYDGINPGNSAHVIFQDEAGNIWIGTWRYGLVKLINPYDSEHFSFKTFRNIKGNSHSLLDNIIYAIAQDKKFREALDRFTQWGQYFGR